MIYNYSDFLNERKQRGLLYHYTSVNGLYGILSNNMIGTPRYNGNVSFTRDKNFHVVQRSLIFTGVRITIDGDKLTDKYALTPVSDIPDAKGRMSLRRDRIGEVEAEEVVKSHVKDISKYILAIDLVPHRIGLDSFKYLYSDYPETSIIGKSTSVASVEYDGYKMMDLTPGILKKYSNLIQAKFGYKVGILDNIATEDWFDHLRTR